MDERTFPWLKWILVLVLCGRDGHPSQVNRLVILSHQKIRLNFEELQLEGHPQCSWDKVTIYDGDDDSDRRLGKFCGLARPLPIVTSGSEAYVTFETDETATEYGFSLGYSFVEDTEQNGCDGETAEMTVNMGSISSPGFVVGHRYPPNQNCKWLIKATHGKIIRLVFKYFYLERGRGCPNDFVQVFDGSEVTSSKSRGKFCARPRDLPEDIVSEGSQMLVIFKSNRRKQYRGFKLTWQFEQTGRPLPPGCDGNLETFYTEDDTISSPGYPSVNYPTNVFCEWMIIAPEGMVVKLDVHTFSLDKHDRCEDHDALEVYRDETPDIYCGDTTEFDGVTSTGSAMTLVFYSDDSDELQEFRGFLLAWEFVEGQPPGCRGEPEVFNEEIATIQSPGYPTQNPKNSNCSWIIVPPDDKVVVLEVIYFKLEEFSPCEIMGALHIMCGMVDTYCASNSPEGARCPGPMFIFFMSDDDDQGSQNLGFELTWTFTLDDTIEACRQGGTVLSEESGYFSSPVNDDDDNYPPYSNCSWHIIAPEDMVIRLGFIVFELEGGDCVFDTVTVFDGTNGDILGIFCGSNLPPAWIESTGNHLFVVFISDSYWELEGFKAQYAMVESYENNVVDVTECGKPHIPPFFHKIVGGEQAFPHSWPWQISLLKYGAHDCGGSVLSPYWILTAAHCLQGISAGALQVKVGSHERGETERTEEIISVEEFINHEDYDDQSFNNDIALVRLSTSITYGRQVAPVCLPSEPVQPYTRCITTGWGETQETGDDAILNQVHVPIVPFSTCQGWYSLTENMICAGYSEGGKDSCQGDSGGPLVCPSDNGQWVQYGITSWGEGCAVAERPGVYTNLYKYLTWIEEKIGGSSAGGASSEEEAEGDPCGDDAPLQLTGEAGVFTSPNYASNYPRDARCSWLITVPEEKFITLNFEDFRLEGTPTGCPYDSVAVYDGDSTTNSVQIGKFCGDYRHESVQSTRNKLLVTFNSDWSNEYRGFKAYYIASDALPSDNVCGKPAIQPYFNKDRIVGGEEAVPHSWPWQITLGAVDVNSHLCGGSLLSDRWVLTAAHCIFPGYEDQYSVRVGRHEIYEIESSSAMFRVEEIIVHEDYDSSTEDNDIALLRLRKRVKWTAQVSPICLPAEEDEAEDGTKCVTTGWGRLQANDVESSPILNQVEVPIVNFDRCSNWYNGDLTSNMICAGYEEGLKDSCQGDSGGPLVCPDPSDDEVWELHGVTSWGFGCALPENPGVYTRVTNYRSWIRAKTNGEVIPD